jgi:hypothetical protein
MAQLEVYKHSGRLGTGLIVLPVMAVIAAIPLGIAYTYADVYMPVGGPIVSSILALAVGALVGVSISAGALMSKCRNSGFVKMVGFLGGLLAFYSAWASFVYVLAHRTTSEPIDVSMWDIFSRPDLVWGFAKAINEEGWFTLRSLTPSGILLWVIWACEALIFLVLTPVMSFVLISDRVFCEESEQWCEKKEKHAYLALSDDERLLERIADGDIATLTELPTYDGEGASHLRIDLHQSPDQLGTKAMQVKLQTTKQDAKGKSEEESKDVTPMFLLSKEQFERIEALAHREPVPDGAVER